jgi:hypothetical protein
MSALMSLGVAGTFGTTQAVAADSVSASGFVVGPNRVMVYQTELVVDGAAYGLDVSKSDTWVVSILDVTNVGTVSQTISLGDFHLVATEGGDPIASEASQGPSSALGLDDVQADGSATMPVDSTIRVAVAFAVPAGVVTGFEPSLGFGVEQTDISSTVVDALDATALSPVQPWTGTRGTVQAVPGNGTIQIAGLAAMEDVPLAAVDTPPADGCFGAESSKAVTSLSGGLVWIEGDPTSDGALVWYWDSEHGHLALLNQHLIEEGLAGYDANYDGTAYASWLQSKSVTAQGLQSGLWEVCQSLEGEWINHAGQAPAEGREGYTWIDTGALVGAPDSFDGEKIAFQGEVFNILAGEGEGIQMQLWVITPAGEREAVFVHYYGDFSAIQVGSALTVYGEGEGTVSASNAYGETMTQPRILAEIIDQ